LGERFSDPKLGRYVRAVREEIRTGATLSEAFERQGVFPPVYISSLLAGERSGALAEVLDRYINYQRLSLAVRRKLLLSLIYPSLLIVLVIVLIVFLVTYVVPNFAELYSSMSAQLPAPTQLLIAVGTTARNYILAGVGLLVVAALGFRMWARTEKGQERLDRWKLRTPILGEIWIKYQVAQLSRILGTLLAGGIPLVPALETTGHSLGSTLLQKALEDVRKSVREGQGLARSMERTGLFPPLAVDMVEVGESTGALASMLNSVAEFFEDDVQTR
ncbi:MAG: type II secretion system F family protein, partial [Thermoleophilia bacterium]|nr:type II secretion system F family protein [Thermoleophilia bacterium]